MVTELQQKFDYRINKLDSGDKQRFLHGVYKQLATSHAGRRANGEYASGIAHLDSREQTAFVDGVAFQLCRYGLTTHALRLLHQYHSFTDNDYVIHTATELSRVKTPLSGISTKLFPFHDGLSIDIGGFLDNSSYCASIVLHDGSYGHEDNLFEIQPLFRGLGLKRHGLTVGDCFGWLSLENALRIAQATVTEDESALKRELDKVGELDKAA